MVTWGNKRPGGGQWSDSVSRRGLPPCSLTPTDTHLWESTILHSSSSGLRIQMLNPRYETANEAWKRYSRSREIISGRRGTWAQFLDIWAFSYQMFSSLPSPWVKKRCWDVNPFLTSSTMALKTLLNLKHFHKGKFYRLARNIIGCGTGEAAGKRQRSLF